MVSDSLCFQMRALCDVARKYEKYLITKYMDYLHETPFGSIHIVRGHTSYIILICFGFVIEIHPQINHSLSSSFKNSGSYSDAVGVGPQSTEMCSSAKCHGVKMTKKTAKKSFRTIQITPNSGLLISMLERLRQY